MALAFSEYSNVVNSVWGKYSRVEGFDSWGKLPIEVQEGLEEVSLAGFNATVSVMAE